MIARNSGGKETPNEWREDWCDVDEAHGDRRTERKDITRLPHGEMLKKTGFRYG